MSIFQRIFRIKILSVIIALIYTNMFLAPLVSAQSTPIQTARILITELQTESLTDSNEEFIEITNISGETIDLSGWTIQYRAASGTSWSDKAVLSGYLYPDGSLVISSQTYLTDISSFFWSQTGGVLAATGGNIRLLPANAVDAEDTLAWGTGVYGEGEPANKAPKGETLQRKNTDGVWQDTNNNVDDFVSSLAEPIASNIEPPADQTPPDQQNQDNNPTQPVDDTQTSDPVNDTPPVDTGENTETPQDPVVSDQTNQQQVPEVNLADPVINELLIDPAMPQTDALDEWVELYNPNDTELPLKGYKIQTGTTFSHSYSFVDADTIQPHGYLVIYSADTNLTLSNTAGAVRLITPDGIVGEQVVQYDDSEEGNSFALDTDGTWKWTTTPTPMAFNTITLKPEVLPKPKTTTAKSTSKSTKSTSKTTAKPKTTAVKSSTTKNASSTNVESVPQFDDTPDPRAHNVAIAVFVVLAVGYACYEYRDDFIQKVRLIRRYLDARRAARTGL